MRTLKERYYHIAGTPRKDDNNYATDVDNYVMAQVYYHEGGYGLFTGDKISRAYFMSVSKCGRGKNSISVTIFQNDGAKLKLKEVARQSKKAAAEAIAYFDENIDRFVFELYPDLELEFEDEKLKV